MAGARDQNLALRAFDIGIDERHVKAYTGLARLLTRMATMRYQNRSVQAMVEQGDTDLQTLIEAMIMLIRYYDKSNSNERKTVLGFFEVEIPFASKPRDKLLSVLARAHQQGKATEYGLIARRFALAEQGLTKVALGHQKMREQIDQLSAPQLREILTKYWRDLRDIRTGLLANPT